MTGISLPFNIDDDVRLSVESMLLEVDILKVGIYVLTGSSEVIRTRHIRDDALPVLPHVGQTHPHIPVPQLKPQKMVIQDASDAGTERERGRKAVEHAKYLFRRWPFWFQLVLVQVPLQDPAQARHSLDPVELRWVFAGMLVALVI